MARHVSTSSRGRTAPSGKFPEDELKAGRELELQNMLNFGAFELVDEMPPRKHANDMVWVMSGEVTERGHDFVCVSSRPRDSGTTCMRERQTLFSSSICWQKQRVARTLESWSSTFLLHSCTLEQMRKFR